MFTSIHIMVVIQLREATVADCQHASIFTFEILCVLQTKF